MHRAKVILLCVAYTTIIGIYALVVPKVTTTFPSAAGSFGEMFGAFSAFFSGLAFLGVIYTVWLQTQQVRLQGEELHLQRQDLEGTKAELARTVAAQENVEHALTNVEHALTGQLRATAVSARLAAISLLIKEEVNHLTLYHQRELGENNAAAYTKNQINSIVSQLESEEAKGALDSGKRCFLGNMRSLRDLKSDLESLYEEIKKLSPQ
jgi:hypothetical protein